MWNYQNGTYQNTSSTTNTYEYWDSAQLKQIVYDPDTASTTLATTQTNYYLTDYGGTVRAEMIIVGGTGGRILRFDGDMNGQYVRRTSNNVAAETYYRFGGKLIGQVGNNGTDNTEYATSIGSRTATPGTGSFRNGATTATQHADFDQSVQQISSYYQGSSGGLYTARAGDTLSSVAAALWGDASLWYQLAEANGLSGDAALSEGQTLAIPVGAMKNTHNAGTKLRRRWLRKNGAGAGIERNR